jgi:phospholipid N-methyltransferase
MKSASRSRFTNGLLLFLVDGAVANYKDTGAIAPSSPFLAKKIAEAAGVSEAERVLEIGPGTGIFTSEVLRRIRPNARFAAIEKNPSFVNHLRKEFPTVRIIEGCATRLGEHLRGIDLPCVDAVVSGLPWAAMPEFLQTQLLTQIYESLSPNGTFATFAYFGFHLLPAGRKFRQKLQATFPYVSRTAVEIRNLPPAFVYVARKTPVFNGSASLNSRFNHSIHSHV